MRDVIWTTLGLALFCALFLQLGSYAVEGQTPLPSPNPSPAPPPPPVPSPPIHTTTPSPPPPKPSPSPSPKPPSTPWYDEAWVWVVVVLVCFGIILLIALPFVIKFFCCQSKKKMEYTPINFSSGGSHSVTDQRRAEMREKYGDLNSSAYN